MAPVTKSKSKAVSGQLDDMLALLIVLMAQAGPPKLLRKLIAAAGSPSRFLGTSAETLVESSGHSMAEIEAVLSRCDTPEVRLAATRELKVMRQQGVELVTTHDAGYPALLRTIPEPPLALWVRGAVAPEDVYALALLGSSRCTDYGRQQSELFATALARHGITVINGGERGIDVASLEAALAAGGRVIVALGAGLMNHQRPAQALYDSVVDSGRGAVVSSVPLQTAPDSVNQVKGDHLVIGSSIASLIVEAGAQSGAMIAARIAVDQIKRQVFAVPGPLEAPNSAGPLRLIADGRASITIHPDHLLDALVDTAQHLAYRIARAHPVLRLREARSAERDPLSLLATEDQKAILSELHYPQRAESLASSIDLPTPDVQRAAYRLALSGVLSRQDGKYDWVQPS
ncbi:MAG: DNA-processing protein DprA [Planctomycetota bacterium]